MLHLLHDVVCVGGVVIHVPPSIFEQVNPVSHLPGLFPQQGSYKAPQEGGGAVVIHFLLSTLYKGVAGGQQ